MPSLLKFGNLVETYLILHLNFDYNISDFDIFFSQNRLDTLSILILIVNGYPIFQLIHIQ